MQHFGNDEMLSSATMADNDPDGPHLAESVAKDDEFRQQIESMDLDCNDWDAPLDNNCRLFDMVLGDNPDRNSSTPWDSFDSNSATVKEEKEGQKLQLPQQQQQQQQQQFLLQPRMPVPSDQEQQEAGLSVAVAASSAQVVDHCMNDDSSHACEVECSSSNSSISSNEKITAGARITQFDAMVIVHEQQQQHDHQQQQQHQHQQQQQQQQQQQHLNRDKGKQRAARKTNSQSQSVDCGKSYDACLKRHRLFGHQDLIRYQLASCAEDSDPRDISNEITHYVKRRMADNRVRVHHFLITIMVEGQLRYGPYWRLFNQMVYFCNEKKQPVQTGISRHFHIGLSNHTGLLWGHLKGNDGCDYATLGDAIKSVKRKDESNKLFADPDFAPGAGKPKRLFKLGELAFEEAMRLYERLSNDCTE